MVTNTGSNMNDFNVINYSNVIRRTVLPNNFLWYNRDTGWTPNIESATCFNTHHEAAIVRDGGGDICNKLGEGYIVSEMRSVAIA